MQKKIIFVGFLEDLGMSNTWTSTRNEATIDRDKAIQVSCSSIYCFHSSDSTRRVLFIIKTYWSECQWRIFWRQWSFWCGSWRLILWFTLIFLFFFIIFCNFFKFFPCRSLTYVTSCPSNGKHVARISYALKNIIFFILDDIRLFPSSFQFMPLRELSE